MAFERKFVVRSKGYKLKETEDETKKTFNVYLQEIDNHGVSINLHSPVDLGLKVNDELVLKAISEQKSITQTTDTTVAK